MAAAGVRALCEDVPADRPMRWLQTVFAGPVPAGDARIDAQTLRAGGSATLREARLSVDGSVRMTATAAFGATRASRLDHAPPAAPAYPEPGSPQSPLIPYIEGVMPVFTQRTDMAFAEGSFPFTGQAARSHGGWVRMPEAIGPRDPAMITALLDVWPCPALQCLSGPAPASTMSWTVHFHPEVAGDAADWCRFRAETDASADGYHVFHAWLWDRDGRPLASATQHVAVFG